MFSTFNLTNFGNTLKKIRINRSITQNMISKKTGISEETIRRIERGLVIPKYETLEILSYYYNHDLLAVLRENRVHSTINELYDYVDRAILCNDTDIIRSFQKKLEQYIDSNDIHYLINPEELTLLVNFFTCTIMYFESKSYSELRIFSEQCLKDFNPDFSIKETLLHENNDINLNPIEVRIIILISLTFAHENCIKESNMILLKCLNYLENEYPSSEKSKLTLKVLFNISYNYHLLDRYNRSLEYAEKGINLALENSSIYCLPQLFFRKGIAQYQLSDKSYKETLSYSIKLLEMQGDNDMAKLYYDSLNTIYNIELEL